MIEDKTAVVVVASYRSVSRNPVRFKALSNTHLVYCMEMVLCLHLWGLNSDSHSGAIGESFRENSLVKSGGKSRTLHSMVSDSKGPPYFCHQNLESFVTFSMFLQNVYVIRLTLTEESFWLKTALRCHRSSMWSYHKLPPVNYNQKCLIK